MHALYLSFYFFVSRIHALYYSVSFVFNKTYFVLFCLVSLNEARCLLCFNETHFILFCLLFFFSTKHALRVYCFLSFFFLFFLFFFFNKTHFVLVCPLSFNETLTLFQWNTYFVSTELLLCFNGTLTLFQRNGVSFLFCFNDLKHILDVISVKHILRFFMFVLVRSLCFVLFTSSSLFLSLCSPPPPPSPLFIYRVISTKDNSCAFFLP